MTVRVRFAPSPTGRLHVGNVRTALINWLFAARMGGDFLLRIDDTDIERSKAEHEAAIEADLTWLGLTWADKFSQSARFGLYDAAVATLKSKGLLYPCFETADELERKRKIALARGRPPVYDRAALSLTAAEIAVLEAEGHKPHWRFKLSGERVEWNDLVRGPQSIDSSSLSDPILIREDGSYLYTLPSVVDDIEARITHVVRGEDHVTNSGAQIEIFRALGGTSPEMAHTPLLIGADGQGLSKRLGSLSVGVLRDERGLEPMALSSLLAKLGTSDNVEAVGSLATLAESFDFAKIGRAPARFDEADLMALNAALVHQMDYADAAGRLVDLPNGALANEAFWLAIRGNVQTVSGAAHWLGILAGDLTPEIEPDDKAYLAEAARLLPEGPITPETWGVWTGALKLATGRKGRGLFMPLRLALTGEGHGPEMDKMIVLLGRDAVQARLQAASD